GGGKDLIRPGLRILAWQANSSAIGVLHAAVPPGVGEMEEKYVVLKGTVVHPLGGGGNDLFERGKKSIQDPFSTTLVRGRARVIDDHAIFTAFSRKVLLAKFTYLNRGVHQLVVVVGGKPTGIFSERSGNLPVRGQFAEFQVNRLISLLLGVDKNFCQ